MAENTSGEIGCESGIEMLKGSYCGTKWLNVRGEKTGPILTSYDWTWTKCTGCGKGAKSETKYTDFSGMVSAMDS